MQLTMALQGSTPQPTTSMETSTTMNHPRMRSGVQDPTVQEPSETSASALRPLRPSLSPGPPPYMAESEFGATNNSQSMNGRHAYIVLDGVCHVLRVRDSGA
jgi:hypothetical protein